MGSILTPFIGTPPGPPRAPGRGKFPGAGNSGDAPGRARPPAPGRPGPKMGRSGPIYIVFLITQGGFWGVHFWPPRDPPGGKKVHIFLGI